MSRVPTSVRAVWKSAELLIAFHKNKNKQRRDAPYFWRPKDAFARLLAKPEDQETVVVLRGADDNDDVQIKMHSDKIVVRRDRALGWSGVVLDDTQIRVVVDNVLIRIDPDGGVVVEKDAEKTHLEGSGEIFRFTPNTQINVSADGRRMWRETEDNVDGFSPDGLVSRRK
ncbi:MAG: hypothetical protein ABJH07_06795 [Sedimentitalea sp.]|uniref:hypothetical protein n=1 Tax=Sedimentitalea sp. TaxID=2048915 RepID=UPI00326616C4